jgi:hypothetical protein
VGPRLTGGLVRSMGHKPSSSDASCAEGEEEGCHVACSMEAGGEKRQTSTIASALTLVGPMEQWPERGVEPSGSVVPPSSSSSGPPRADSARLCSRARRPGPVVGLWAGLLKGSRSVRCASFPLLRKAGGEGDVGMGRGSPSDASQAASGRQSCHHTQVTWVSTRQEEHRKSFLREHKGHGLAARVEDKSPCTQVWLAQTSP